MMKSFQQEAYVNRASIAMDSMARYIIPININLTCCTFLICTMRIIVMN